MSRPYVKIKGTNMAPEYVSAAMAVLPEFIKMDGVLGVTLNGGVSRGYADELSEIDLTVYLESQAYQKLKTTKAPLAFGITVLDGYLYDIKTVDFNEEEKSSWEPVKLWDASYAKILYDPDGSIARLLADKLQSKPAPEKADGDLFACWWCFRLAGDIWLRRGDSLQGHLIMNEAVQYLLKALFVLNGEYIPHEKWLLHMSRTLAWTPPLWEERLAAAMLVPNQSPASLKTRQDVIDALWSELDARLRAQHSYSPALTFRQHNILQELLDFSKQGTMTTDEFDKRIGLERLNFAPYHQLFRLEKGMVIFDENALAAMTPDQLYSWQYEVVVTLRSELNREV